MSRANRNQPKIISNLRDDMYIDGLAQVLARLWGEEFKAVFSRTPEPEKETEAKLELVKKPSKTPKRQRKTMR